MRKRVPLCQDYSFAIWLEAKDSGKQMLQVE
jgi:hypothetical protein